MASRMRHQPVLLLTVCVLLATVLVACGGATSPGSSSSTPRRDDRAERITALIREYYGSVLGSVTVGPEIRNDGCPPMDMYVSEYHLRDLPLSFPFRISTEARAVASEAAGGAEGERSVTHEDMGGVRRFYKLARQFHVDFPDEQSMSYWLTSDNDVASEEPYRSILRDSSGLSVVVYAFDDYSDAASSKQLGISWWSEHGEKWVLIHRGSLPTCGDPLGRSAQQARQPDSPKRGASPPAWCSQVTCTSLGLVSPRGSDRGWGHQSSGGRQRSSACSSSGSSSRGSPVTRPRSSSCCLSASPSLFRRPLLQRYRNHFHESH